MKICLVSYEFPPSGGGEGTYTFNLARGLLSLGHSVVLVVPDHVAKIILRADLGPIIVRSIANVEKPLVRVSSFLSRAIQEMPRIISYYGIDVVHFTFDYPPFPVKIEGIKIPIVSTLHHLHIVEAMNMIHSGQPIFNLVPRLIQQMMLDSSEASLLRQSDAVIAVSEYTRRSSIRYSQLSPSKVCVVPNGIEARSFAVNESSANEFKVKYGLRDEPIVLYVGRLDRSKGVDFLVRSFEKVSRELPSARLIIVGSGDDSYRDGLVRESNALGLSSKIVFTGRIKQALLQDAYRACSLLVLPSLMEGFGLTLLEAMSFAKPVVASRVGGVPELVEDKHTGLLVEPGEPEELSTAILNILTDSSLSKKMGEKGRSSMNGRFTIEAMSDSTLKVYQRVRQSITRI